MQFRFQSVLFDSSFFKCAFPVTSSCSSLSCSHAAPTSTSPCLQTQHQNHRRHLTASRSTGGNTVGHLNSQTHKWAPLQNQTNGREVPQWRYLPTRLVLLPRGMHQQKPPPLIKSIKSSVLYFKPLHCNPVARRGAQAFHLIVSKQIVWMKLTKGSFLYLCGNVSKKAGAGHSDSFAQ